MNLMLPHTERRLPDPGRKAAGADTGSSVMAPAEAPRPRAAAPLVGHDRPRSPSLAYTPPPQQAPRRGWRRSSRMFVGLTSRCAKPRAWSCTSASTTCSMSAAACGSASRPWRASTLLSVGPARDDGPGSSIKGSGAGRLRGGQERCVPQVQRVRGDVGQAGVGQQAAAPGVGGREAEGEGSGRRHVVRLRANALPPPQPSGLFTCCNQPLSVRPHRPLPPPPPQWLPAPAPTPTHHTTP